MRPTNTSSSSTSLGHLSSRHIPDISLFSSSNDDKTRDEEGLLSLSLSPLGRATTSAQLETSFSLYIPTTSGLGVDSHSKSHALLDVDMTMNTTMNAGPESERFNLLADENAESFFRGVGDEEDEDVSMSMSFSTSTSQQRAEELETAVLDTSALDNELQQADEEEDVTSPSSSQIHAQTPTLKMREDDEDENEIHVQPQLTVPSPLPLHGELDQEGDVNENQPIDPLPLEYEHEHDLQQQRDLSPSPPSPPPMEVDHEGDLEGFESGLVAQSESVVQPQHHREELSESLSSSTPTTEVAEVTHVDEDDLKSTNRPPTRVQTRAQTRTQTRTMGTRSNQVRLSSFYSTDTDRFIYRK